MDVEIKKQNEDGFGLKIIDDSNASHRIGVGFDGEIVAHQCRKYPDNPSQRTTRQDENFSQARRYARYHVYREKGYDTLSRAENPDRIAAVVMALLDLSGEQFREYFGELYEQSVSHDRSEVVPPLDLPDEVYDEEFLVYKQNVYLEADIEAIQSELDRPATQVLGETERDELATATGEGLISKATSLVGSGNGSDVSWAELAIEGVSGIDTMYYEDTNEDRTIEGVDPFDRDPDARIEIVPSSYERENFRYVLGHNLICQIRDCYIGMGLEPPEPYRVLGHGKYKYTGKYRHFDCYEPYFDHEANVPGYVSPV